MRPFDLVMVTVLSGVWTHNPQVTETQGHQTTRPVHCSARKLRWQLRKGKVRGDLHTGSTIKIRCENSGTSDQQLCVFQHCLYINILLKSTSHKSKCTKSQWLLKITPCDLEMLHSLFTVICSRSKCKRSALTSACSFDLWTQAWVGRQACVPKMVHGFFTGTCMFVRAHMFLRPAVCTGRWGRGTSCARREE